MKCPFCPMPLFLTPPYSLWYSLSLPPTHLIGCRGKEAWGWDEGTATSDLQLECARDRRLRKSMGTRPLAHADMCPHHLE